MRYRRQIYIPLPTSILHILSKGIFQGFDMSAVNDVRVTSCSPDCGKNKGARESSSRVQFSKWNPLVFNKRCRLKVVIKLKYHILFLFLILWNWKNKHYFFVFRNFQEQSEIFENLECMYECTCWWICVQNVKSLSWKTTEFCRFECPKGHFLRYLRGFRHFSCFRFSDLGRSKSFLR